VEPLQGSSKNTPIPSPRVRSQTRDPGLSYLTPSAWAQTTPSTIDRYGMACVVAGVALAALLTSPAIAQVQVQGLRVGFGAASDAGGNYKVGCWAPATVKLTAEGDGFDGSLELATADSDDVPAMLATPVRLAPGESVDVATFVKAGKMMPSFHVRLADRDGKAVQRAAFSSASGQVSAGAPLSVMLIVAVGGPAGLELAQLTKRPGYPRDLFRIGHVQSTSDLPDRWFGYEGVDHLIISADDPTALAGFDASRLAAIESWVKHGGKLIITTGGAWDQAAKVFAGMLPADVDRMQSVSQLPDLESYLGSSVPPVPIRSTLSVPHLTNVRGRVVVGRRDLPLVVAGAYGLGTVTLVPLELSREPFRDWDGLTDLWLKLLAIRKQLGSTTSREAWSQTQRDLSSHLRRSLEQFAEVPIISFQWVALCILGYVLLVGPLDYWLLRRIFKRMELTWVTFPISVAAVSVAAYFAVHSLKGNELRVNKIDVVDVDHATASLRGTSWFTLFSPRLDQYSIKVSPAPGKAAQPRPTETVVSWLGVPEDTIGGMARRGGVAVFQRGYQFEPQSAGIVGVPLHVWSMKSFTARWHGPAPAVVDVNLTAIGTELRGSLSNRFGVRLEDCHLAFARKIYPLGDLPAPGSMLVETRSSEDLRGHLSRRVAPIAAARNGQGDAADDADALQRNLIYGMMFHQRLPEAGESASSDYFRDLDLSSQLDLGRAVLVARVAGPGCRISLNGGEPDDVAAKTFVRVVLPVTLKAAPAVEPDYRRP